MDTRLIELRMAVRALPTDNKQVQLAVKSEVLRLAELLDAAAPAPEQREEGQSACPACGTLSEEAEHDPACPLFPAVGPDGGGGKCQRCNGTGVWNYYDNPVPCPDCNPNA